MKRILNYVCFGLCASALMMAGCHKKSGDDNGTTTDDTKNKNVDTAVVDAATETLALAGSLALIPGKDPGASLTLTDTDYDKIFTNVWVQDDSMQALDQAGTILCVVSKTGYIPMVNKGQYVAQVNMTKCGDKGGGGSGGQAAAQQQKLVRITVESTRKEHEPLIGHFWLQPGEKDQNVYGEFKIAEGASAKNPLGIFRMMFSGDGGTEKGFLETDTDAQGKIRVRLFDKSTHPNDQGHSEESLQAVTALIDYNIKAEQLKGGQFATHVSDVSSDHSADNAYNVSFDRRYLHRESAGVEKCLDQNSMHTYGWNYNLYDSAGARVTMNANMSLEYTSGGQTYYGNAGYFGIWMPESVTLTNGMKLTKHDWQNKDATEEYTVVVAKGKLMKNTKVALTLAEITNVDLGLWPQQDGSPGQMPTKKRIVYDGTKWQVTGHMQMSMNSPSTWVDDSPTDFSLTDGWYNFDSDSLGNINVIVQNNAIQSITSTTSVDWTNKATGALTLKCYNNCPLPVASASATVFDPEMQNQNLTPVVYTFDPATLNLTRQGSGVVEIADGVTLEGQYQSGVMSGNLIPSDVSVTTMQDISNVSTFYTWTMGNNQWSRFTGLKGSNGAFVVFDAPLNFTYTHSGDNDFDGAASSAFYGKKFMMQYGGPGNLWGIPSVQSGNQYLPQFAIRNGTAMGDYRVKLIEGQQSPVETAVGNCSDLPLTDVPAIITEGEVPAFDYVTRPTDDGSAPAIIDGEVPSA